MEKQMNNVIKLSQLIEQKYSNEDLGYDNKYNPEQDISPQEVMEYFGRIEELLTSIKNVPWISDTAVMKIQEIERVQIPKLHKELEASIKFATNK